MANASVARFKARLAAIPVRARAEVAVVLAEQARRLTDQQRRLVPKDELALAGSIRFRLMPLGTKVLIEAGGPATTRPVRKGVSVTFDYALAQEFGTAKMAANPFFFPAYRLLRTSMKREIARGVKKGVKAAYEGK